MQDLIYGLIFVSSIRKRDCGLFNYKAEGESLFGRAQAKITKAITKMEAGNFGDHKPITDGNGLHEHRIDSGPGYRIYYITEGEDLIILFAGSDKSDQQKVINQAKDYLADYKARKPKNALKIVQNKGASKKSKRR